MTTYIVHVPSTIVRTYRVEANSAQDALTKDHKEYIGSYERMAGPKDSWVTKKDANQRRRPVSLDSFIEAVRQARQDGKYTVAYIQELTGMSRDSINRRRLALAKRGLVFPQFNRS